MKPALILGAAVWENGPSPTLERRTLHAAHLYHQGLISHLIPCGGLGQHPSTEAAMMATILTAAGVPPEKITLEDRSHSTLENIRNAIPLLNGTEVLIVTDSYHAPRARLTARRLGLIPTSSSPDFQASMKPRLREIAAYGLYWLRLTILRSPAHP